MKVNFKDISHDSCDIAWLFMGKNTFYKELCFFFKDADRGIIRSRSYCGSLKWLV